LSTISFTSHKQGIQDLLAALPAPANAKERPNSADAARDAKPGFVDLLRDSAQSQAPTKRAERAEPADAIDTLARGDAQEGDQAVADQADAVDQNTQANDTQEDSSQDASQSTDTEQGTDQTNTNEADKQPEESSDEAQLQAAANAAAAQLNVVDAVTQNQPKAQAQANANPQIDLGQAKQAASSKKAGAQNQANGSNLSLNAALPNQAQTASAQVVQADASATAQPVLQQGDTGQANSGDTGGDSKAATAATNATTTASSNSNAAAAAAFAVSDQAGSEARLPINPAATTQTADVARQAQAQAQSAIGNADHDSLNTARLTRGLANAVQQRGGAVTMRLTPPEMGTVRIQMQITGTNVSATFHAESASAQTLLTNQLAQLRSALESKGMSVDRLSVQPLAATAQAHHTNQSQNQSDTQQQGQSQQQSAGDGRSRGQYSGSSGQQSSDQQQDSGSSKQAPRGFFDRLNDASEPEAA